MTEPTWRQVAALITADTGSIENRLPERIRYLRESHRAPDGTPDPLSHTALARRLADVGWTTDRTTLWKIENPSAGNGRRKIAIDELVAFARAFGVTVEELMLPAGDLSQLEFHTAAVAALEARRAASEAWRRYVYAVHRAQDVLSEAADADALRRDYRSTADELRERDTRTLVKMWRAYIAKVIERGERAEDAELLKADDAEDVASASFRRFVQFVSEQPVHSAYDDILAGERLALDATFAGCSRTVVVL